MNKITKTYRIDPEVAEMLKRMSTENLRTLSGELELAIRERYRRLYQEQAAQREPSDA